MSHISVAVAFVLKLNVGSIFHARKFSRYKSREAVFVLLQQRVDPDSQFATLVRATQCVSESFQ